MMKYIKGDLKHTRKNEYKKRGKNMLNNDIKLLLGLAFLGCSFTLFYIQITNELIVSNYSYAKLIMQVNSIKQENNILEEELLTKKALTTISNEAIQQGYIPTTKYIYLH